MKHGYYCRATVSQAGRSFDPSYVDLAHVASACLHVQSPLLWPEPFGPQRLMKLNVACSSLSTHDLSYNQGEEQGESRLRCRVTDANFGPAGEHPSLV
jgi:hypothetical protein